MPNQPTTPTPMGLPPVPGLDDPRRVICWDAAVLLLNIATGTPAPCDGCDMECPFANAGIGTFPIGPQLQAATCFLGILDELASVGGLPDEPIAVDPAPISPVPEE